jgi:hypothetical protein
MFTENVDVSFLAPLLLVNSLVANCRQMRLRVLHQNSESPFTVMSVHLPTSLRDGRSRAA